MTAFIMITGIIALTIIILGIVSIPMIKKRWEAIKKTGKYPEGHFIGLGIAIGLPLGLPLAISTGNYGLMGIGIAIGVAIGAFLEVKAKKQGKIRPLTKEEKNQRKILIWVLLGLVVLGALVFLKTLLF